ncbi:MAG: saccharopine dehydrogenase NADP-binding domain-containing protein, partial [Verrucomicrobiaceae bacterium]
MTVKLDNSAGEREVDAPQKILPEILRHKPHSNLPSISLPFMKRVLIIGAGGVGRVVAHKCAQAHETFSQVTLASRTKSKCDLIAADVEKATGRTIDTAAIDADDSVATAALIRSTKSDLVINVALPYQDLHIMDACLA